MQKNNNKKTDETSALKNDTRKLKEDKVSNLEQMKMKCEQCLRESENNNDDLKETAS